MKRTHLAIKAMSASLIAIGVGLVGFAGSEILQMNSSLGSQNLPKLDSSLLVRATGVSNHAVVLKKPKVGDFVGSLSIPRLKTVFPIIQGTGAKELKRGVGHYVNSVMPGFSDNAVLAGHRDSVFRRLGDLQIGDLITFSGQYGEFTYEVHKIRIVNADDRTVIVSTKDAILTLSTCYPFRFIGNAPKRYIVQAGLVIGEPIA